MSYARGAATIVSTGLVADVPGAHIGQQRRQGLEVDRLQKMLIEARLERLGAVRVLAISGHGNDDGLRRFRLGAQAPRQFTTARWPRRQSARARECRTDGSASRPRPCGG